MRSAPVAPMVNSTRDERGIALVMALLVLLVMSLLAATLMMSINVDTKIAAYNRRENQALNIAEAGVAEAISRIRAGDVPTNNNARQVAQIFNTLPGTVPVLGVDSIALATKQPVGQWLDYTTAGKSDSVLTVAYKDSIRAFIYRYDPGRNPAVQTNSGFPIFVVTSTGRVGSAYRRIVAEVIQKPFNINVKGALSAEKGIDFSGNSDVCGLNHSIDTPVGTRILTPDDPWELGTGGDVPGAWSSSTITSGGSSAQDGNPPDAPNSGTFYNGPWEVLGMQQAEFFSWLGSPLTTEPQNPQGVYYLDNNGVSQDASGDFKYNGGNGEGMLYVDGDLAINGNFNFKGLVYVEGDLKINGNCWILGALMVKGHSRVKIANGTCTVLYSADAISQGVAKHAGQFVTLSWRESKY